MAHCRKVIISFLTEFLWISFLFLLFTFLFIFSWCIYVIDSTWKLYIYLFIWVLVWLFVCFYFLCCCCQNNMFQTWLWNWVSSLEFWLKNSLKIFAATRSFILYDCTYRWLYLWHLNSIQKLEKNTKLRKLSKRFDKILSNIWLYFHTAFDDLKT